MEEYKPNSHRSKAEAGATEKPEKKVEKVVTGSVTTRKKGEIRKFADVFISEDAQNVKSYILMDVLVPAIKKAIADIVTDGINMVLYGDTARSRKRGPASKVSYRDYFENGRREANPSRIRNTYDYDDIIFDSRGEAERVLASMDEVVSVYGVVSVNDYYDLCGVDGDSTSNKYGWSDIRSAQVMRVRDGYAIKLPRALPIN